MCNNVLSHFLFLPLICRTLVSSCHTLSPGDTLFVAELAIRIKSFFSFSFAILLCLFTHHRPFLSTTQFAMQQILLLFLLLLLIRHTPVSFQKYMTRVIFSMN